MRPLLALIIDRVSKVLVGLEVRTKGEVVSTVSLETK